MRRNKKIRREKHNISDSENRINSPKRVWDPRKHWLNKIGWLWIGFGTPLTVFLKLPPVHMLLASMLWMMFWKMWAFWKQIVGIDDLSNVHAIEFLSFSVLEFTTYRNTTRSSNSTCVD